jgi:hypothetical protein
LAPAPYPCEAALHDLVEKTPQMLPLAGSPRLTILGREVRLGTGYADLLAVESSGRLVIIVVKLAASAESRRAVVGQVLSYAGYLQGLDPGQLESQVLATQLGPAGTVLAAVEADDQQYGLDRAAFQEGLARALADGSFRLVIVLDSAPDEQLQVIGYLELITDKIDIDLVTVTAYEADGSRVLVRRRAWNPRAASGNCRLHSCTTGRQAYCTRARPSSVPASPPPRQISAACSNA